MRTEKIVTVYPTVIKPGLAISHLMPPDPLVFVKEYPSSFSFYLTSLMYLERGKRFTTELDVFFNGKSVLSDAKSDENELETFMFSPINESSIIVGSALFVKNVELIENGTYDISYKLYEEIDGTLGEVIDQKFCSIVSSLPPRD